VRNTAFVAVGLLFLVAQSNFFRLLRLWAGLVDSVAGWLASAGAPSLAPAWRAAGSLVATPNLVLPLIVFAGVHEYSLVRGAALAFVLGYALDLFAAAPVGLFTCVSVCTFLLARAAGVRLAAQTVPTQLGLAFLFALAQGLLVLALLAIFGRNPYGPRALASVLLPHAASTALFAPLTFRVAARLHQATISVPRAAEGPLR
jgi:rod shape-determining protein MreD